jgi:uncharacterized membrane protein YjjP (DUF1212 family)
MILPDVQPKPTHELILRAGSLLHSYGTPSHRLERVLTKISADLGMRGVFLYTPTGLLVSLTDEDGERTYLRRVDGGGSQIDRLIRLDDILDDLSDGKLTVAQAIDQLEQLEKSPQPYNWVLFVAACTLASAAVAILFRGNLPEVLAAAGIGAIIGLLQVVHEVRRWQVGSLEPLSGLVASVCSLSLAHYVTPLDDRLPTLAALIVMIPGLRLTMALTELAVGHWSSGVARLAGASVSLLTLIVGVGLGWRIAGSFRNLPVLDPNQLVVTHTDLWQWTAILVAPITFAILFQARWPQWPIIVAVSVTGFIASKLASQQWGIEVGAFAGALTVGLGSNLYARFRDRPALVPFVPGILILVPGSLGYRSLTAFLENQTLAGIDFAFRMMIVGVSLVAGILTANALIPPKRLL